MAYPEQFGHPCWEKDQADKCINTVAQVTKETVPLFLATHSPIKSIKDAKVDAIITEEDVFQNLFLRQGEIRGVVRGDSGTGKSHLIRWVNLRSEYAAENKEQALDQFKIVMVQRDTGSLKSALQQIVDQLGDEFSQYIEDIRGSVDKFSAETAREELIQKLALEISSKWEQRGNQPLPNDLKPLGDVLLSPGYRKWLGRDGGVIAQKIARLTESSNLEERKKDIVFTSREFIPEPQYLNRTQDAQQVYEFIEGLEWDDIDSEEVVKVLNKALVEAQRELTGIRGSKLHEIFTAIRRKLYTQGKLLAVFIEDVTAASGGLDLDLFQALEPKVEQGACRMIALLGMTNEGWNVLPDNEKDRVDVEFDVGVNASHWAADHYEVAKFTARYLNALRSNDQEINALAQNRFGSDISYSKCDECKQRGNCHDIFGYVQLDTEVKIGLFPFSPTAPQKLLSALNEERHRTSQRGLLDYVLEFALIKSYHLFSQGGFPDPKLIGVKRPGLTYWAEVENKYLGGFEWSLETKNQAQFLTQFWLAANSADKAASLLEPYRAPFSLPEFSTETILPPGGGQQPEPGPGPGPTDPPAEDIELTRLIAVLDSWIGGEEKTLTHDAKFRKYLSEMLSKAMRWQDYRGVPVAFAKMISGGTSPIRIEGQKSKPASQHYFIDFFRDIQTRNLLEALTRYDREGKKSWNFANGELHKRRVYGWLRKNKQNILTGIDPDPSDLRQDAIRAASQLMALAAIIRRRTSLPIREPQKRITELFIKIWGDTGKPRPFTSAMAQFVDDIEIKWEGAKKLIINELGVGQGEAAPKDFIDPLPILTALDKFEENPVVQSPPETINENFWKKRFEPVSSLGAYDHMPKKLEEERKELKERLGTLKAFLIDSGFEGNDLRKALRDCLKELVEVIQIEKENLKFPNQEFMSLWEPKRLEEKKDSWGSCMVQVTKVIDSPKDLDTLCFDSATLSEAYNSLTKITKEYLLPVDRELTEQEEPGGNAQEGKKEDLLNELKQLSEMMEKDSLYAKPKKIKRAA